MDLASFPRTRAAWHRGPPGVHVEHVAPVPATAAGWTSGVPIFIGFGAHVAQAGTRALPLRALAMDRWDAQAFAQADAPAPKGFLRRAVRAFFANGGRRCAVLMLPLPGTGDDGSEGFLQLLAPGGLLEDRNDFDLVCVPDAVSPAVHGLAATHKVQAATLTHCATMGDRFAILDAPWRAVSGAADPVGTMLNLASSLRSPVGALYFPWVRADVAVDGLEQPPPPVAAAQWRCVPQHRARAEADEASAQPWVPPCGQIAGLYARLDALVGPQRAPANEVLEGVVDTSLRVTAAQHALLNEGGVNCLRNWRGRGIEVGGARTLGGASSLAFVSTARVVTDFRRWLAVGMREFVFEPLTEALWERIRIRLLSRCLELQRAGALAGSTAAQAFFVKCDAETNPPEERALGRVVAQVGLAPSVPAEFIVVRVVHDASGSTLSGLS